MTVQRSISFKKAITFGMATVLIGLTGCSSGVAPSKTVSGLGTGAVVGGLGGAAIGSSSSMGTGTGAALGAGAGALVGGIVGMVQDARDRKEQDRLAQERAYQQELAKKRQEEVKMKAEMDEELAIAQGFRISEIELNDAQKKLEIANERLKKLMDERSSALAKKKNLDEAREKTLATEAKIAQLEEELSRLKGEEVQVPPPNNSEVVQKKPDTAPPPPAVKPGT
jgi:uncharacterized membrane protein YhiD involved in acid resistance